MRTIDRRYVLTLVQLVGPLVGAWAIFTYGTPLLLLLSAIMFFLMSTVGNVITYHRIYAHQTHTMHPVVEAICVTLGFYGTFTSPVEFCAQHPYHHQFSDKEKDPHGPHVLGWKTLFPILWNTHPKGHIRTIARLRRNKIATFFYKHFWLLSIFPFILLFFSTEIFLFGFLIPSSLAIWSVGIATYNHDADGPRDMGLLFSIVSGGEHKHKWHHAHPNDTSGEGWLNTVINIVAEKRVSQ